MFYQRSLKGLSIAIAFAALALQGCATADRRVDVLYHPTANVKGGSGDVYLVQGVRPPAEQAARVQWVLGDVKNDDGNKKGKVVSDTAPARMVQDALNRELTDAGYHVITTDAMPQTVEKAVVLKDVVMKLDETAGAFSDEANCSVKMSVQPWRGGAPASTGEYQAEYTDTAVADKERLPSKIMLKTMQLLMSRAVPELVKTMEQK